MTVFNGTPDNDVFTGTGADDTFNGLGGIDRFYGGAGDETFNGGPDRDYIFSSPGVDIENGDEGDDYLYSLDGDGPDHLDGGTGTDEAFIRRDSFPGALTLNIADPTILATLQDGTTVVDVERLEYHGGSGSDSITGGAFDDRISGLNGDDTLDGSGGDDVLAGGTGNDNLDGGPGADYMLGSYGDDTYAVDSVGDRAVEDEGGIDTVKVSVSGYRLNDGVEHGEINSNNGLTLMGNALDNVLSGGPGNDTLLGSSPHWANQGESDRTVDVDGDGEADIVQIDAGGSVHVWLSTGATFSGPYEWLSGGSATLDKFGDFDGDHQTDLIHLVAADGGPEQKALVALSTGANFSAFAQWGQNVLTTDQVGDLNGDGRSDLVQLHLNGSAYVWLSNGAGFDPYSVWGQDSFHPSDLLADVNGDGRTDVVQLPAEGVVNVRLSNGLGFDPPSASSVGLQTISKLGDFNGDGMIDLLQFNVSESGLEQKGLVALSTGSGYAGASVWGTNFRPTDQVADVNGDGLSDVIQLHQYQNAYVWLSNGQGFDPYTVWAQGVRPGDQLADFNHDGMADVLQLHENGNGYVWLSTGHGFTPATVWGLGQLGASGNDTISGGAGADNLRAGDGDDSIVGGDGNDTISGGHGGDILVGDGGADTFVYHALSDCGVTGDGIPDFTKGAGGDVLDLRDLLTAIGAPHDGTAFAANWLSFSAAGGNTVVQVDSDGGSGPNPFVDLVTLTGVLLGQADSANYIL